MFCRNCGKNLPDGTKFCRYCGAPQGGNPQGGNVPNAPGGSVQGALGGNRPKEPVPSGEPEKKGNGGMIALVIVLLILALAGGSVGAMALLHLGPFAPEETTTASRDGDEEDRKTDDEDDRYEKTDDEDDRYEKSDDEDDWDEKSNDDEDEAKRDRKSEDRDDSFNRKDERDDRDDEDRDEEASFDEEETEEDMEEPDGDYVISDSASRYLSESDLDMFTPKELTYARNEIYARHGAIFKSSELNSYFGEKSWYQSIPEKISVSEVSLSKMEESNAGLILNYQNEHNMTYSPK